MSELTEAELLNLRDAMTKVKSGIDKETRKRKIRILGKAILCATIVAGGVISIVFPNPIIGAVLIGVVAVAEGKGRITHSYRRLQQRKENKKSEKFELSKINAEIDKRTTTREVIGRMYPKPTAPPSVYPYLS